MTVENVQMMWLKTPRHCYNNLVSKIRSVSRNQGAQALAHELADLTDEYWTLYCDVHDRSVMSVQSSIQAWYIFQAIRKILIEYGWWDNFKKIPINWYNQDTEGGLY